MRQRSWRMADHVSSARHVVMGGAPRSGTTLLRRIFDQHPGICAGAETKLFVPAAFNLEWLSDAYAIPLDELRAMRDAGRVTGRLHRRVRAAGPRRLRQAALGREDAR